MEAQLKINVAGGSEGVAVIRDLEQALAAAQGRLDKLSESSRAKRTRGARAERQTVVQEAIATANGVGGAYRQAAVTIERSEKLVTRAKLRELALQGDAQKRFVDLFTRCHALATAAFEREVGKRGSLSDREKRQVENVALAMVASHERAERAKTQTTRRESERRRQALATGATTVIGGAVRGGAEVLRDAHGQIQDSRMRLAVRQSALNTTFMQTGAGADETAAAQASISAFSLREGLSPETVIGAIGQAQSSANALGGDTAAARRAALEATLRDVEFASVIDPENINGLVRVGALARGKMGDDDRAALLRAFAGISFQGSTETDDMISQGLRGLQQAWSTGTAGVTDPAEASRRRLAIARDFAAQVQSAAASGATTTVAANRTNTIPTFLSNDYRQDQLGRAFYERRRTFTDEQRAAFANAFTQDREGRWRMNESVRGRASDAARFFGTMFNNDAGATRNFLGTHGGGGERQLMNVPDVNELVTYFAMATNARGQQVRQYDYVNELGASTITPEREAEMRRVRKAEDIRRLSREDQTRDEQLAHNTGALRDLSDALRTFQAEHPILSTAVNTGGGVLGGALVTSVVNWVRTLGRGAATAAEGAAGAAAPVAGAAARTVGRAAVRSAGLLTTLLELGGSISGTDYDQSQRRAVEGAEWERQSNRLTAEARAEHRKPPTAAEIGAAVAAALQATPLTVSQQDAEHAATVRSTPTTAP
jgi:hypothetical protein